uniref:Putative secreted protein n=1 Tax=Anopheles darlingi TaxID=43151 RepID=A0A2M4DR83_ANODA
MLTRRRRLSLSITIPMVCSGCVAFPRLLMHPLLQPLRHLLLGSVSWSRNDPFPQERNEFNSDILGAEVHLLE